MDCFFAAVEVRDNPELKGKPVAVGGSPEERGVISAANYEARKFGVRSALSSAMALRKCPELILIFPNMQKYIEVSQEVQAIFHKFTGIVEPLSLDEAYLDVTESTFFQGSASLLAAEIRKQIFETTGLTASAGIAPNKFLAKVASDWKKPNGQYVVTPDMIDSFVINLPIEKISGVGKVTAEKMHKLSIHTCGDLQKLSLEDLRNHFGTFGYSLHEICRGIDHRKVITYRERKSLSIERTFNTDLPTTETCLEMMPQLFESFKKRFTKKSRDNKVKTLYVKIKFSDFTATTVEGSFDSISMENFSQLLKKGLQRKDLPVRLIGIGVKFSTKPVNRAKVDDRQLELFEI